MKKRKTTVVKECRGHSSWTWWFIEFRTTDGVWGTESSVVSPRGSGPFSTASGTRRRCTGRRTARLDRNRSLDCTAPHTAPGRTGRRPGRIRWQRTGSGVRTRASGVGAGSAMEHERINVRPSLCRLLVKFRQTNSKARGWTLFLCSKRQGNVSRKRDWDWRTHLVRRRRLGRADGGGGLVAVGAVHRVGHAVSAVRHEVLASRHAHQRQAQGHQDGDVHFVCCNQRMCSKVDRVHQILGSHWLLLQDDVTSHRQTVATAVPMAKRCQDNRVSC